MICDIFLPVLKPSAYVANANEINMTIVGSAKKLTTVAVILSNGDIKGMTVVIMSNRTGSREEKKLLKVPGHFSSANGSGIKLSIGVERIFFSVFANNGPAARIAGMATAIPYKSVMPMLA